MGNWPVSAESWAKRYWPLVACTEKNYDKGTIETTAKTCAKEAGVDVDALLKCYNGAGGDAAILAAAKATIDHAGTPTLLVDGKDTGADDLLSTVCADATGAKPAGCSKTRATIADRALDMCA